jgi:hypothetical protein
MVKYLSFLNSSFGLRYFLINVNGNATVWHTPCWKQIRTSFFSISFLDVSIHEYHLKKWSFLLELAQQPPNVSLGICWKSLTLGLLLFCSLYERENWNQSFATYIRQSNVLLDSYVFPIS